MTLIRILIVDDVPQVRLGLRALLPLVGELNSLQVEIVGEAANGREAVERAIALDPDVILMDLEMPETDGYAAAKAIKMHRPSIRVVALTVHGDSASRQKAQEAGIDEFIEKGASMNILMKAILGVPPANLKGGLS